MGKLVLIRHGQSIWNLQNRFTGWIDVSLSQKGIKEAKEAGLKLKDYQFDIAFTSTLMRAQQTIFEILNANKHNNEYIRIHKEEKINWYEHFTANENDKKNLKIHVSEKLNERFYGDLQGKNKDEAKKQYGEEQVHIWRRSFDVPPPNGESLKMTAARTLPYYKKEIVKELKKGKNILITAHGNSLRAIIMHIEEMTSKEILEFELNTGIPHIYEFNDKMEIISKKTL